MIRSIGVVYNYTDFSIHFNKNLKNINIIKYELRIYEKYDIVYKNKEIGMGNFIWKIIL